MPYKDPEMNRVYQREYARKSRLATPLRIKETKHKYRLAHPERLMFNEAKLRAKKKGLEFSITVEDIHIPTTCPYLGSLLDRNRQGPKDHRPSLDRIDNTKGYTPENIQVISTLANKMKNTSSREELVAFAHGVLRGIEPHKKEI